MLFARAELRVPALLAVLARAPRDPGQVRDRAGRVRDEDVRVQPEEQVRLPEAPVDGGNLAPRRRPLGVVAGIREVLQ